jgi:alpha-amylase
MGRVTLLIGIHNHQPQGNFEEVFARAWSDCYAPTLDAIERHGGVKLSLHYSGPLAEWLEEKQPDAFDRLGELVARGQVELLGGGFYEPMLSVLPERDALGQLARMADFLEARVGVRPRGMWLAERVWEPDLARLIATAGYRYTILDDGHFLAAGMTRPLSGHYVTEKAGLAISLFPISLALRYAIPFKPAGEAIALLLRLADEAQGELLVTYGDDGEKLGLWPGTRRWVWDEGWLESFLSGLEANGDRIRTSTFSEALRDQPPSGRVYLPTTSYDEMGEWTLPPEAQSRLHELHASIDAADRREAWGPFARGGIWQGFLARYPEANFLHKRMCFVSERVARAERAASVSDDREAARSVDLARTELYKGQCNCAYWHGLFGGLYLAKLRAAAHGHLIRADVEAAKVLGLTQPTAMERADLDCDLSDEVILTGRALGVVVAPARGGALYAVDDRRRAFCVTDVLSRRPEAYHARLRGPASAPAVEAGGPPASIHDLCAVKEEGLAGRLLYDPHPRLAFVDQFLAADADPAELWRCRGDELGDFRGARYDLLQASGSGRVLLGRTGRVRTAEGEVEVALTKSYALAGAELRVEYELTAAAPLRQVRFGSEVSLALPSGPHPSGRLRIAATSASHELEVTASGVLDEVLRAELHDPHTGETISVAPTPAATLVHFPLETVSQSESGIERTYQGTVLVFLFRCELDAGERSRPTLTLGVR